MNARYIAEDGTPITDEMLDEWAREAEEGKLSFRPLTAAERTKKQRTIASSTRSFRIADTVWALAEQEAASQGISASAFVANAVVEKLARARSAMLSAG